MTYKSVDMFLTLVVNHYYNGGKKAVKKGEQLLAALNSIALVMAYPSPGRYVQF